MACSQMADIVDECNNSSGGIAFIKLKSCIAWQQEKREWRGAMLSMAVGNANY